MNLDDRLAQYAPPDKPSSNGHRPTAAPLRLLDTRRMLATEPEPIDSLIDGVVARGTLGLLGGREKEGKSLLALGLSACMAVGGGTVAGIACQPGRVLVVDAENGEREAHRRVRALGLGEAQADSFHVAEARGFDLRNHLSLIHI